MGPVPSAAANERMLSALNPDSSTIPNAAEAISSLVNRARTMIPPSALRASGSSPLDTYDVLDAIPMRLAPAIVEDVLRGWARRGRRYVPIVGSPGSLAMVTAPGAQDGWNSTVPPGGRFDNRIAAADGLAMITTSALRAARRVNAPLMVCVCDRENLMDPKYVALVARRAPRGVARHYDSDHFAIYHPPLLSRVLVDQTAFLREHLNVDA